MNQIDFNVLTQTIQDTIRIEEQILSLNSRLKEIEEIKNKLIKNCDHLYPNNKTALKKIKNTNFYLCTICKNKIKGENL